MASNDADVALGDWDFSHSVKELGETIRHSLRRGLAVQLSEEAIEKLRQLREPLNSVEVLVFSGDHPDLVRYGFDVILDLPHQGGLTVKMNYALPRLYSLLLHWAETPRPQIVEISIANLQTLSYFDLPLLAQAFPNLTKIGYLDITSHQSPGSERIYTNLDVISADSDDIAKKLTEIGFEGEVSYVMPFVDYETRIDYIGPHREKRDREMEEEETDQKRIRL